jgi:hypothetical protein
VLRAANVGIGSGEGPDSEEEERDMTSQFTQRVVQASIVMTMVSDDDEIVAVPTDLRYDSTDAYAVRMTFSVPGKQIVSWVFARDLLITGVLAPAGLGDVQVFPTRDGVALELTSPAGAARLTADLGDLAGFVAAMVAQIPLGAESEYCDLDTEIAQLTGFGVPGSAGI